MTFNILITVDNSEFLNVNLSTRSRYRHSYHAFKSLKIENRALKLFLLKGYGSELREKNDVKVLHKDS